MIANWSVGRHAGLRASAIHSFGFAASNAKPKLPAIMAASCGIEPGRVENAKPLLDAAIDLSTPSPTPC